MNKCKLEDFPGCSGDPNSCPENEGHGCGKPYPVVVCKKCGSDMERSKVLAPNVAHTIEPEGCTAHITEVQGSIRECMKCKLCGHSFLLS